MANYSLTPAERLERVKQLKAQRLYRQQYNEYLKQEKEQRRQEILAQNRNNQRITDQQNAGFFERVGASFLDIASQVITGAAKSIEGIYDLGASVVGAVGGIFDSDFQRQVQEHIAYDWTDENLSKPLSEIYKYSYLNDLSPDMQNILRGVGSAVGQMLPTVAVTALTGGLGAPTMLAQGLGMTTFVASAGGIGTEEAFQEGADFYSGLGFGLLNGLVEGAIEKVSGGMADKVFGKGLLDGFGGRIIKKVSTNKTAQKGLKILMQTGGEAAEEWAAEFIHPYLKRITYDKDAPLSTQQDRLESGVIGALASLAFRGSVGRIGARNRNVQENLANIETLDKKLDNLWGSGKLDEKRSIEIERTKKEELAEASDTLSKMKEKSRADFISKFNLSDKFNPDGSLIEKQAQFEQTIGQTETLLKSPENGQKVAYNTEAYSPTLKGNEESLIFKPTKEKLNENQRLAKQEFTRLNKGKMPARLVFTNELGTDKSGNLRNGAYKNGILYINTKANSAEVVMKHELTHFAEGTKEYFTYADFVLREINSNDFMKKKFGDVIQKINTTSGLYRNVIGRKNLNAQQKEVLTEVIAQYTSENLFTNQEQIDRLAKTNRNFVQKVFDWIKSKIDYLNKKKKLSADERELFKFLRKAEKLYSKTLEQAWGAEDALNKIVEDNNKKVYNKKSEVQTNGEKADQKGTKYSIGERGRVRDNNQRERVFDVNDNRRSGKERNSISKDYYEIETKEGVKNLIDNVTKSSLFKEKSIRNCYFNSINEDSLPQYLLDVKEENKKLGIETFFVINTIYKHKAYELVPFDEGIVGIYIPDIIIIKMDNLTKKDGMISNTLNHERLHHIQLRFPELYSEMLNKVKNKMGFREFTIAVDETNRDRWNFDLSTERGMQQAEAEFIAELFGNEKEIVELVKDDVFIDEFIEDARKKLANKSGLENIKFSLSNKDSKGRTLTKGQQEFFKDSKVRDENGKLLPVYHVSPNSFTIFDKNKIGSATDLGAFGRGFYFGNSKWSNYGQYEYNVYLNIKNPLILNNEGAYNFHKEVLELAGKGEYDNITTKDMEAMTQKLIQEGYDGVIYEPDFDKTRSEYVAFEPNQIKLTTNKNPTENKDIRFSLERPVEYKKDLLALHNLSSDKLLETIELGGLAMPSIAIIRDSGSHNNFGNISLIIKPNAIDPRINYDNKVYSADAYTSRFPQVDYSLNEKKLHELAKEINTSYYSLEANEFSEGKRKSDIVDSLKRNELFMRKFAQDKNIKVEKVLRKAEYSNSMYYSLEENLTKNIPFDSLVYNSTIRNEFLSKFLENSKWKKVTEKRIAEFNDLYDSAKTDTKLYEELKSKYEQDVKIAKGEVELVEDSYSYIDGLKNAIKQYEKEYNIYTEDIVESILSKRYLRNNKDYYTNSGNPRSFSQLHEPFTAENAVRLMKENGVKNNEGAGLFGIGVGEIKAALSKEYHSIEDIHQDKHRIQNISEESEKMLKQSNDELHKIANKLALRIETGNFLEERDIALSAIFDIIAKTKTDEQAKRLIKKDYTFEIGDSEILEIRKLAQEIDSLPVKYFEAKPERVVSFDEVVAAIIPENAPEKLKNKLDNVGIKYYEYKLEDDNSRVEVVNKVASLDNVRFSLENKRYKYSKGQVEKYIARKSKFKSYSKTEAEVAINDILSLISKKENYVDLSRLNKKEAINKLWIALNSKDEGKRAKVALEIADYVLDNATVENVFNDNFLKDSAVGTLDILRNYHHKLDLSSIKEEISHKYDKNKSPYLIWGAKKGERGIGPDVVAQELAEFGITINANNPADIFIEINELYKDTLKTVKKQANDYLKNIASDEEIKRLKNEIAREILTSYDTFGKETEFSKIINKYQNKIKLLTEQLKDIKARNKATNNLFESIERVKNLEKYQNSDVELAGEVAGLVKLLKPIKTYRGNLSKNVRNIMSKYSSDVNGKKLYNLLTENDGMINPFAEEIESIARNRGELTTNEIINLDKIILNFIHNVNNYNKVIFESRQQEDMKLIEQAIKETQEAKKIKDSGFSGAINRFGQWLTAPIWRFERLSSYRKNGIMSRIFGEFQKGVSRQAEFNRNVSELYAEFFKKNKKTVEKWHTDNIEINGTKLTRGQMINLYMLAQREQARKHLFAKEDGSGIIRLTDDNIAHKGKFKEALTKGQDFEVTQETISLIESKLTEAEKEFINLTSTFFNKIAKDAKYDTDMLLFGVSNVGEENYIPIRVSDDQFYKQLDDKNALQLNYLFNSYSFNKEVNPNAKNKIVVENILDVVNRHTKQMSAYYGYAIPVKTFNRLYNKKTETGERLRIELAKVDSGFENYVKKLIFDMQGHMLEQTEDYKILNKIRGWGAKAALGANLKVIATQFVSLPASAAIGIKYRNIVKGLAKSISGKNDYGLITKYIPMLFERFREGFNVDIGRLKEGQGVMGGIDRFTNLIINPISQADKFVIGAIWHASVEQTKNNKAYENFSDEHYKKAAELVEKAVIKTQANYIPAYRPSALRSQNTIVQFATMFMSEPMQQFSLLASSIDKIKVAKALLKNKSNDVEAQNLLKQAKTEARYAVTAIAVDSILLVLIAQAFKWLKGNEDEDVVEGMVEEFTSNFVGMFPFIKDIYANLQGFDITNMAYTGLTNIATGIKETWNIIDLMAGGKAYNQTEINGKFRKTILGFSQLIGIPTRNLESYLKGIVEKISPSARYKFDSIFNLNSSYSKDLQKAISAGDDKLADTILDIMLDEQKASVKNEEVRKEIKTLYEQGFDVLPKSVNKKIAYDNEIIELTNSQYNRFKEIYSSSEESVKKLINSKLYKQSDSDIQAKSIKTIYNYSYSLALEDLIGLELENNLSLVAKAVNIEELSIILANVKSFGADVDKKGKSITGTKKAKVQKYLNSLKLSAAQKYIIMGYLGYKNERGASQVKNYIQSLKLSKIQKENLFKASGYY